MLTIFKEVFTWWNQQTVGTRIQTFFYGKYVGKDKMGNKYYQSNSGKRWVIYNGEVEASKIPDEWYSWMHHMNNKIEKSKNIIKYHWQKTSQPNKTGTDQAYHPNKENNEIKKKYTSWKK